MAPTEGSDLNLWIACCLKLEATSQPSSLWLFVSSLINFPYVCSQSELFTVSQSGVCAALQAKVNMCSGCPRDSSVAVMIELILQCGLYKAPPGQILEQKAEGNRKDLVVPPPLSKWMQMKPN